MDKHYSFINYYTYIRECLLFYFVIELVLKQPKMHLLTSRTLLALCSLVMFSFEGACSRRIARSSSYSTTNISCDKENGLNYYRDNPMLAPEIQTLQLVKRPLRSTDLIYHYGVLATLESGLKVLIDKVIFIDFS